MKAQDIIEFWYSEAVRQQWFKATRELDEKILRDYCLLWQEAAAGLLDGWNDTPEGSLALAIVLDQFPLNMFRGQARSFATEAAAIRVTKKALAKNLDMQLPVQQRAFLYMPLMHSENLDDQDKAIELFANSGLQENLRFAHHHRSLIARFGRFPHRNTLLQRENTEAEKTYLKSKEAFLG